MEFQYKRIVHYLGQLVLHQDYERAIHLGNRIVQKGFRSNQLVIMISYAIKMSQGNIQAIEFIQKMCPVSAQNNKEQSKQLIVNPLIQFAKGQYYGELKRYEQSCKCYKQLLFQQNQSANKTLQNISTPLQLLTQNYSQISMKRPFNLSPLSQKMEKKVIINIDQDIKKLIDQVNLITKQYRNQIVKNQKNTQKVKLKQKQWTKEGQLNFGQKEFFNRVSEFSQQTVNKNIEVQQLNQGQMKNIEKTLQKLKEIEKNYNQIKRKFIKKVYDCEFATLRIERQKSTYKKKSAHNAKRAFQNKSNSIYKSLSKQKFSMHNKLKKPFKIQPFKQNKELQKVIKKGTEIKQILIQVNQFSKFIKSQILQKQKVRQKFQFHHKRTIKNSFEDQQNCVLLN